MKKSTLFLIVVVFILLETLTVSAKYNSGIVTWNGAIIRKGPAQMEEQLEVANSGEVVSILGKYEYKKDNEAVLIVDKPLVLMPDSTVYYEKRLFKIGTPLIITSEEKINNTLFYKAKIDNKKLSDIKTDNTEYFYLNTFVRKVKGDIWYKIRLRDGTIGWLFGEHLQLQNS